MNDKQKKRRIEIAKNLGFANKGRKRTEEQRKANSERGKSYWQHSERRKNQKGLTLCECGCGTIVKNRYAQGHYFKGERRSDGSINKNRLAHLGKKTSEETKRKMRLVHLGIKPWNLDKSHPSYQKWLESMKNPKRNKRISLSKKGKKFSDEHRKKLSLVDRWKLRGKPRPEEVRRKISFSNLGRKPTEETRLKSSITHRLQWKDPQFRNKMLVSRLTSNNKSPNKPETTLLNILNTFYPTEWKFVGNGQFWITYKNEHYNPDFINCNGRKLIIEMFGTYWHRNDDGEDRTMAYKSYGYDTLIIWEHELNSLVQVQNKIKEWIEGGEIQK